MLLIQGEMSSSKWQENDYQKWNKKEKGSIWLILKTLDPIGKTISAIKLP